MWKFYEPNKTYISLKKPIQRNTNGTCLWFTITSLYLVTN